MPEQLARLKNFLFFLLILLLPTQLAYHFWPESAFVFGIRVDYLAPTIYLTDILVVLVLATWMWEERRLKSATTHVVAKFISRNTLFIYLSIYLLINVLFFAQNQPAAVYKLFKLAELFLLGLYVSRHWRTTHRSLLATPLSLAVIYASIIGIAQFFAGHTVGGPFWFLGERTFGIGTPGIATETLFGQEYSRAYSTFSHPNSFAGFLLVSGVLLLPWKTALTRVAVILGITAFILAFSQAAWVAAVLLAGLLTVQKLRAVLVKPYTIAILALVAFLTTIVFWWSAFLPKTEEIVLRQGLAEASLKMLTASPLFGVGLNNFVTRLPEFSSTPQVAWWLQPVHNVFLLVLAEIGLIGLTFFLWFLYLAVKRLAHDSLLGTALLVILLTGALDHYWLTLQQNQLLGAILLGGIFSKGLRS